MIATQRHPLTPTETQKPNALTDQRRMGPRDPLTSSAAPGQERLWRLVGYDNQAWRHRAACRQVDAALFFPTGSTGLAAEVADQAKTVCLSCPVRGACLQFALTTNQEFGVWGGHDEDERRQLRRDWRTASRR